MADSQSTEGANLIQAAFVDAPAALIYTTKSNIQAYILNSPQVAAVKAYSLAGLELPQNQNEFNQRFPPTAWQIDDPNNPGKYIDMSIKLSHRNVVQIPNLVENLMLQVYSQCNAFGPKVLSALQHLTASIVKFYGVLDIGIGLKSQVPIMLKVLADPNSSPEQISNAQVICGFSFEQVIPQTVELFSACATVLGTLSEFHDKIVAVKPLLDFLFRQVFVDPSLQKMLSSDIAQLQQDITTQQANMSSDIQAEADDAVAVATGVSLCWMFPWGTLACGSITAGSIAQFVQTVKDYQASEANILKDQQQIASTQNSLDWIHQLQAQVQSMDTNIGSVITAVEEMQSSFPKMQDGFGYVSTEIATTHSDAMATSAIIRQLTDGTFNNAIQKWGQINEWAQAYLANPTLNWSTELPPPSVSA